jgi:aspartate kinase
MFSFCYFCHQKIRKPDMSLIFKFGGASIKDAESVKNIAKIVTSYKENLIIVVSAMGKTTRALHSLATRYYRNEDFKKDLHDFWDYHLQIIKDLSLEKNPMLNQLIADIQNELGQKLAMKPSTDFDYEYDQLVCAGELVSSIIISSYLNLIGRKNQWVDIRNLLKTDSNYRDARINWENSGKLVRGYFDFSKSNIYLTQGFIASSEKKATTTLGLEGSDYTAAALAYFMDAEKLVVWKDVAGFYNSDPKEFEKVIKLDAISYHEAVELAYYGAKVIHPKTIKPLENKNIPLWVKSFKEPGLPGTVITASTPDKTGVVPMVPVYITKNAQILISIAPLDFSFIAENNLEHIFSVLAKHRIKVNLMQNSAISFSICTDYDEEKINAAINVLKGSYKVLYNNNLTLITIRHINEETIREITKDKEILVQQRSRNMARFVVR